MTMDLPINGRLHSVKTVREQEWLVQMFGPRQLQTLDVIQAESYSRKKRRLSSQGDKCFAKLFSA